MPLAKPKPAVAPLQIRLLGEISVLREGTLCPLPASKKTRALLGYLVATGRSQSREHLCELFWEVPDDPRGALRWSLSKIRPLLDGPDVTRLNADRDRVAFEACGAEVDLLAIRALQARGLSNASLDDLQSAAERCGGPFLECLDLPDCVQFYTWCSGERERARGLHVALLKTLIARLRDDPERALLYARALVTLDPLAESSHLEVIRLLADAGKTRDALEEYDRCRRILEEQIGARPSAELERLRASLKRPSRVAPEEEPDASDMAVSGPAPVAPRPSQLVGRRREREALERFLHQERAPGTFRALLLLGEPGMGKTRLLEELGGLVMDGGGRVLQGRAFEGEGVRPYGVWLDTLDAIPREGVADHLRTDLALLFPELGAPALNADRTRLFDAVLQLLRGLATAAAPLLVILDDLQWIDEASASLLHYVVRNRGGRNILLACAARAGELEDNPSASSVVRALERERTMLRISLEPLSPDETGTLARQVFPGVDVKRVHAEAEGNPLFVLELARALSRGETDTSVTLGRIVRDRLDALDDPEQAVLPWAASLGRSFEVDALTLVSGLPASQLLDGLARLERHGVLRASGASNYDFSHDVVRGAAYARLSEPRRRLVHLQIARSLWQAGGSNGRTAGEVLLHAALAGEHELAARASIAAGERCIRLFAYPDARDLSRRGLEHAQHLPPRVRLPLEVELLGLRARWPSGAELVEIDQALEEVARAAEQAGLNEAAARAHQFRSLVAYGSGDFAGALASSERQAEKGRGSGSAALVLGAARCLAILERDMNRVVAVLEETKRALGPDPDVLDFYWTRGLLRRYRGEYLLAISDLERAALETTRDERHWERCWCLNALALAELERGETSAAARWAAQLEEVAARTGDGVERSAAAAIQALAELVVEPQAWRRFDRALEEVRRADGKVMFSLLANFAAERAFEQGCAERAHTLAKAALVAATGVSQRSQALVARATLARLATARGDESAVREEIALIDAELLSGPETLSARARAAAERARAESPDRRPLLQDGASDAQ